MFIHPCADYRVALFFGMRAGTFLVLFIRSRRVPCGRYAETSPAFVMQQVVAILLRADVITNGIENLAHPVPGAL